jgi:hypothetical protein
MFGISFFQVVTGLLVAEVNVNTMCELGSGGVSLVINTLLKLFFRTKISFRNNQDESFFFVGKAEGGQPSILRRSKSYKKKHQMHQGAMPHTTHYHPSTNH